MPNEKMPMVHLRIDRTTLDIYAAVADAVKMPTTTLMREMLKELVPLMEALRDAMEAQAGGSPLMGAAMLKAFLSQTQGQANQVMQEMREYEAHHTPAERGEAG